MTSRIAIYGGTFDPIHYGHLRSAEELRAKLSIDQFLLVPSSIPPHRSNPGASAEQRLAMLRHAVEEFPHLTVDSRELERTGVSYSIETIKEIREEVGDDAELFFVMGADAYALIHEWRDWQDITEFVHIVVMERPNSLIELTPMVLEWQQNKHLDDISHLEDRLSSNTNGCVLRVNLTQWDISATEIRLRQHHRDSIEALVPNSVSQFIQSEHLYD